jgi:hypothetical protein
VSSSAEAGRRPGAAFIDLDKTTIAKSGTLAYGPSFYRNGLISRGNAVRGAVAQLLFSRYGASYRLADCSACSDSITDLPMLEAVGHPHAVNPDRAPRRLAQHRGRPVHEFGALPPARPAARP